MKKIIILIILVMSYSIGLASSVKDYSLIKNESLEGIQDFKIKTLNSRIEIISTNSKKAEITVHSNKKLFDNSIQFRRDKGNLVLEILDNIDTSKTYPQNISIIKNIVIKLPNTFHNKLTIDTTNGFVTIKKLTLNNGLDVKTSNNRIEVYNINGNVDICNINGSVDVSNISKSLSIKSTNGKIEAKNIKGDAVLKTTNGGVDVTSVSGNLKVTTINGRIDVKNVYKWVDLFTSNAPIEATKIYSVKNIKTSDGQIILDTKNILKGANIESSNSTIEITSNNFEGDNQILNVQGIINLNKNKINFDSKNNGLYINSIKNIVIQGQQIYTNY